MISRTTYQNKISRQISLNEKIDTKSEKQAKSLADSIVSQRPKSKGRIERERPVLKEQIKKLAAVKINQVKKDQTDNDSSEMFSRTNGRVKISIKSARQYNEKVNQNGFSRCFPPFTQILPPLIIFSLITEIAVLTHTYMADYQIYIIWSVMGFLMVPITYFWYLTTSITPTDSIQIQHLGKIQNPSRSNFQPEKHKYFCNLCKTCISHKSFHCNKCNRCVEYFDHHCKWLNNCIGAKNYIEFIQLVVLSELFMFFFYTINAVIMMQVYNEEQTLPVLFWIAVGTVVASLVPFVAISMLLCLHLYLFIAKRATIDLILENRKKNKIYPHNSTECLPEKGSIKYKDKPIPQQSPVTSPDFQKQHQIIRQLKVSEERRQSLKKFVSNLASNLRLTKKQSKLFQQNKSVATHPKINFKPTILKKTTYFARDQILKNTLTQQKMQKKHSSQETKQRSNNIGSNKNEDYVNEPQLSDEMEDTGKNLVTKLRFSTKKEILDEQNQATQRQDPKKIQSQTQRSEYDRNLRKHPKRLEPLQKNQTERKIKFVTNIKNFEKESINREKDTFHLNADKAQLSQNDINRIEFQQKKIQVGQKPKSTRILKVMTSNKHRESQDSENLVNCSNFQ